MVERLGGKSRPRYRQMDQSPLSQSISSIR
jgi:hypothetical protein